MNHPANKANQSLGGIIDASVSSLSFGLSPFFSVSLLMAGLSNSEVLTYRWGVATIVLVVFSLATGKSLATNRKEFIKMLILSVFRALTSMSLLYGYANISSGVASTIHFMYPVVVAVCMMFLFGERKSPIVLTAALLAIAGAYLLASDDSIRSATGGDVTLGVACSACSVFCYAAYMILLKKTGADQIESTKLTCYVMGLSSVFFFTIGSMTEGIRLVTESGLWVYILGISVICTTISNFFLVRAVKKIGPTLTSILGALEPLTAVIIGVAVFGERLTVSSLTGMALILATVTIVVTRQSKMA